MFAHQKNKQNLKSCFKQAIIPANIQAIGQGIWHRVGAWAHQIRMLMMPPRCGHCKLLLSHVVVFCDTCTKKIMPIVSVSLSLTATRSIPVFAVSAYQQPLKSLVLAKSRSDRVASRELGELIYARTPLERIAIDCFIIA